MSTPKRPDFAARVRYAAAIRGGCQRDYERVAQRRQRELAEDAATLRAAAAELDALWKLDAARGGRDAYNSSEYVRVSRAPRLRAMADEIDPPAPDLEAVYGGTHAAERASK